MLFILAALVVLALVAHFSFAAAINATGESPANLSSNTDSQPVTVSEGIAGASTLSVSSLVFENMVLREKQATYDSFLNTLVMFLAATAILVAIILFAMGVFGYNSLSAIRDETRKEQHEFRDSLNKDLDVRADRLVRSILKSEYTDQLNELSKRMSELENKPPKGNASTPLPEEKQKQKGNLFEV